MTKKLIRLSVIAMLLFFLFAAFWGITTKAEETDTELIASGACGEMHYAMYEEDDDDFSFKADESVKYRLYKDGTMVISGSGKMGDFDSWCEGSDIWYRREELIPWYDYRDKIRKVVVEDGVTTIGSAAFYGCKNLESIQWADSIKDIGNRSFYGCKSLESIPWTDGIERVGCYAFQKCTCLKEVRLPSYIKEWWWDVFAECTGLKKVSIDTDFQFSSEFDEDYSEGMFRGCTALEEVQLPKDVTVIPSRFVEGCSSLTDIEIADTVKKIGGYAFYCCTSIKKIKLPSRLGSFGLGSSVFYGCTSLEEIDIPKGMKNFYDEVFYNCKNLKSVTVRAKEINLGEKMFYGCKKLSKITLYAKDFIYWVGIDKHAFDGIPKGVTIYVPKDCVNKYKKQIKKSKINMSKIDIRSMQ